MFKNARLSLIVLALFFATRAGATPVTFGFSGQVEWDYYDVPVGSILYGSITYDSDTPLIDLTSYQQGYRIDNLTLTMGGETATHSGGSIVIFGSQIEFHAGPDIAFGGGTLFSNQVDGIDVRGFSIAISGSFNELPNDPTVFYGSDGDFWINRSGGPLYDVNSLANLQIPPGASSQNSIPEPAVLWLLGSGLLGLRFAQGRCQTRHQRVTASRADGAGST